MNKMNIQQYLYNSVRGQVRSNNTVIFRENRPIRPPKPGFEWKQGKSGSWYQVKSNKNVSSGEPGKDSKTKKIDSNLTINHLQKIMDISNNPKQRKYYGAMLNLMEIKKVEKLTNDELNYVKSLYKQMHMSPKMKDCYLNAQKLALQSNGRITCVEGFYLFPDLLPFPLDHSWCKINGKNFDPTQLLNGKESDNVEYFGMDLSIDDIRENMIKTGMYSSVSRNKISKQIEQKMNHLYNETEIDNVMKRVLGDIPPRKRAKMERYADDFKNGKTSKNKYLNEEGNYTPERLKLHDKIISKVLSSGNSVENPTIVFSAGLPGSGKTYTLKSMGDKYDDYVTVSGDDIKEMLPEFDNGDGAVLVHDESKDISSKIFKQALEKKFNIILDGTMKTYKKALKKVQGAKEKGYSTFLLGIELPAHKSIERASVRFKKTGRYMPYGVIKDSAKQIYQSIEMLKTATDNYKVYNTDVAFGEKPKRVEKMTEQKDNENKEFDAKMSKIYADMASDYEEMIDDIIISEKQK